MDDLARHQDAKIFFAENFTMFIWPAGAAAWQFLEQRLPDVPKGTMLRFLVRESMQHIPFQARLLAKVLLQKSVKDDYDRVDDLIHSQKPIDALFRERLGIHYEQLIAPNYSEDAKPLDSFFLCFQPLYEGVEFFDRAVREEIRKHASAQHDFVVKYLVANGASEIYSCQAIGSTKIEENGAWDYFRHSVQHGCIVVSLSFTLFISFQVVAFSY